MKKPDATTGFTSSIDWPAIHHRLDHVAKTLEQGLAPAPGERKRILKERARILAREEEAHQVVRARMEVIEFVLAYERYAIESRWVREVYPLKEITPLPGTPAFVLGIINVRGQIVSVVDLKKFFDLPDKGLTDLNKVIIMGDGNVEFGLLADAVPGMRQIPRDEIQPPLPTMTGVRAEYVQGLTADRLAVLNVAKILADPAIKVCQSMDT
jgi:purine-binding chemotaxis protein CheW